MTRAPLIINIPHGRRVPRQPGGDDRSRWIVVAWLLGLTTAGVLFCGMFPFDFVFHWATAISEITRRFDPSINQLYTANDGLENVVFFMPTGFALSALFIRNRQKFGGGIDWIRLARWVPVVIVCGAALSALVEFSQVYLLSRDPSLADICSNTTGTLAGCLLFIAIGTPIIDALVRAFDWLDRSVSPKALLTAALLWLALAALLPLSLGDVGSLASWNPAFPLMIGNETTGDRFWNGSVKSLWIADHALDDTELDRVLAGGDAAMTAPGGWLSYYSFSGRGPYSDALADGGALHWIEGKTDDADNVLLDPAATRPADPVPPALASAPEVSEADVSHADVTSAGDSLAEIKSSVANPMGVTTGDGWWLRSRNGAESSVIKNIARNGSFSVVVDVFCDDLGQINGPPRIVSISMGTTQCDLQLLQERDALYIRLRNAVAGEGGSDPEAALPGVFDDAGPLRIVVTYDRGRLMAATDHRPDRNQFLFTPESALIWLIYPRPGWAFRLDSAGQSVCGAIYRLLAMWPIGVLITLAANRWRRRDQASRRLTHPWPAKWTLGTILGAAIVLEIVLCLESRQSPTIVAVTALVGGGICGYLSAARELSFASIRRNAGG